jgi:putative ABC transport system ATP-binding protein
MTPTLISVKNLVKTYTMGDTQVHALRGVSLDINNGDFTAIMGASGSGKSTFMNIIGCLNILARTSALENVELPLVYNNKVGAKERRERAMKALTSVGLATRVRNMPNQLSGGQQQRVAIARALINDPRVIMADEPTGNLDSRTSYEIMDIFQQLNDKGITIVMVTHEPDIAMFAKDNIVFRDGSIISNSKVPDRKNAVEELKKLPAPALDEVT